MAEKGLKILMIAPTQFFGDRGVHVQIYEEAKALKKLGHPVVIVTYPVGRDIQGVEIRRSIRVPFLKKIRIGPSWIKPFLLDPLLMGASIRAAYNLKPDIIHGHLHEGCLIGFVIAKIFRKPLLFDLQGSLTGELRFHKFIGEKGLLYRFFYFMEHVIDSLPDALVTQSSHMVEDLTKRFRIPENKVFLNYDGVDTSVFYPMKKDGGLMRTLNLPDNKRIIVFIGILSDYQGVDLMLRALSTMHIQSRPHILIIGGPNVEKYKKVAQELGVSDSVTFTGFLPYEKAPAYLSVADCAISLKSDDTEANGKLYNYLAMGLPVIASPSKSSASSKASLLRDPDGPYSRT